MTQPDLVSKLREVIAKVKPLMEKATPRPWEANHYEFDWSKWFLEHRNHPRFPNAKPSIAAMNTPCVLYSNAENDAALIVAAVSALDELESLLGREGQAAPATVPQRKVDFCGAVCMAWEDCGDKEYTHHCVLQADHQGKHKFSCSQVAQPAPSPSTPIVPSTAGLSAEQLQAAIVPLLETDALLTVIPWKKIADRLNALLGAEPGVPLIHGRAELDIHDAKIRKSVLEEAAQSVQKAIDIWKTWDTDDGFQAIETALGIMTRIRDLAERPAPAGERSY